MHYFIAKNKDWVGPLEQEILETLKCSKEKLTRISGVPVIQLDDKISLKDTHIAFSTAALINTSKLTEESISKQAKEASELIAKAPLENEAINLDVFSLTNKYGVLETGRAEIIKEKIIKELRKKNIFVPRKKKANRSVVQIMILPSREVVLSITIEKDLPQYKSLLSPFVGGFNNVEDNKKAPSRAFKKIVEAQLILERPILKDETLIDLGACPGGWTYIARQAGAKVIALDRSELREDLMNDSMVEFVQADAFKYKTERPLDWAISDIICTPQRILELIDTWVVSEHCSQFVFTIKFQGSDGYDVLTEFKEKIPTLPYHVILKQLNANKNEVTIMGIKKA
ncbi:SAM-dependent methyltransferase [Halobacteriovorax sp. GB3]|uniref:SAM-dependent methyltransferase n=1 Tax=Halobacteriovorax sp. GB3 TaxID=2719615 RepID=UPI0023627AD6|nr:SAM-dependent methyltransferase [Halobacteriovorax sp. GB3]MDD0851728.1 SAM-dependent methyltransferase [Halobacteriovorax sp. GB3]